jgi:hypothetical protein
VRRWPACPAKINWAAPMAICATGSTRSSGRAEQQGSFKVALSGLNSVRQTLDSLSRLSGFDHAGPQVNVAVQANVSIEIDEIKERILNAFDQDPDTKARIAQALWEDGNEQAA